MVQRAALADENVRVFLLGDSQQLLKKKGKLKADFSNLSRLIGSSPNVDGGHNFK